MTTQDDTPKGYDGAPLQVGDRIEMHPATDLWMSGARFGTIVGTSITSKDRLRFTLDQTGAKVWSNGGDLIRSAEG